MHSALTHGAFCSPDTRAVGMVVRMAEKWALSPVGAKAVKKGLALAVSRVDMLVRVTAASMVGELDRIPADPKADLKEGTWVLAPAAATVWRSAVTMVARAVVWTAARSGPATAGKTAALVAALTVLSEVDGMADCWAG
jgi:hypothetical protein